MPSTPKISINLWYHDKIVNNNIIYYIVQKYTENENLSLNLFKTITGVSNLFDNSSVIIWRTILGFYKKSDHCQNSLIAFQWLKWWNHLFCLLQNVQNNQVTKIYKVYSPVIVWNSLPISLNQNIMQLW